MGDVRDSRRIQVRGAVGHPLGQDGVTVEVQDGVVVALRNGDEGTATESVDGWLMAGFTDAHTHFAFGMDRAGSVDLVDASSPTEVVDLLRRGASEVQSWVVGRGYWPQVGEPVLGRGDLDRVSVDRPIIVELGSGHTGILNSAAMEIAGYRRMEDAPAGGRVETDGSGQPTGVVHERAFYRLLQGVEDEAPVAPAAELDAVAFAETGEAFRRAGITTICEAHVGSRELAILQRARSQGVLPPRVVCLLTPELARSWDDDGRPRLPGLESADVVGVKLYADGSLGGGTCVVSPAYRLGVSATLGEWNTPVDELAETIEELHRRRLSVAVHVNGDEAIRAVVTIFQALLESDPWPGHGHRLEHASFAPRGLGSTMAVLGLTVVSFTGYLRRLGSRIAELYGEAAPTDIAPVASLLADGVRVLGSSDFPCGPLDPAEGIEFLTRRRGADGAALNLTEAISPQAAVDLFSWSWTDGVPVAPHRGLVGRRLSELIVVDADRTPSPHPAAPVVLGTFSDRGELMEVR